eukprot:3650243-Rhodomonas_salina.10
MPWPCDGGADGPDAATRWWYGQWAMFRALALGVILSAVLRPRDNAASCLTLGVLDTVASPRLMRSSVVRC